MDRDVLGRVTDLVGPPPPMAEDEVTKTIERYTAGIPSSAFLAIGLGAIAVSLAGHLTGRGRWTSLVAQWVPAILLMGIYNKLVKLAGHDQLDRGYEGRLAAVEERGPRPVAY
jgi:hypothetical protein